MVLLIIILILLFGMGGGWGAYSTDGYYRGGISLGTILVIILLVYLLRGGL